MVSRENEKCSQLKKNQSICDLKREMQGDDVRYANLQIDIEIK